ncbi:glycosyltransferase family 1 protein [Vararia minispora EC-137]|uniref:Glycosyltransferase family 1 protein n=1 Tax=Vararia minispora EC-137 TaxID=1314806 RepID=A0ACB8QYR4_9AGAM|nr:glycosyltransferase family 1 protein [Vararia minispora EC-137]
MISSTAGLLSAVLCIAIWRSLVAFRPLGPRTRKSTETCSIAVFLGSGGHTSEMLTMVSTLDFSRYADRTYILSEGDLLSAEKAKSLERTKAHNSKKSPQPCTILRIPRARRVKQSILTTPFTAAVSLLRCVHLLTIAPLFGGPPVPDVLLLNGPGTCVVLCLAVLFNRLLGLPSPRMIYVESFARVKSLSQSGKLLQYIVDSFVVQWPQALAGIRKGVFHGWLV